MELVDPDGKTGPFSRFSTSFLPKFCVDVCQDFMHGEGCFQWAYQSIFKVKRISKHTLGIEVVAFDGQTNPFLRSNDPRSRFTKSFLLKFFMEVRQHLSYGADILVIQIFDISFAKKFVDVRQHLAMEPVAFDGLLTSFLIKLFMDVRQDHNYKADCPEGNTSPFPRSNDSRSG
ncbi:hypothetical protein H5410_056681 [Solanum commersonii]|uniref:Uncharacterized protein n=1 Tax=Solanum commersonii TaxID=4109 RepID=A0A9J5WKY4_SOLCO|nr:hypothetical protein H5410_056681 [Solanum commersonii]